MWNQITKEILLISTLTAFFLILAATAGVPSESTPQPAQARAATDHTRNGMRSSTVGGVSACSGTGMSRRPSSVESRLAATDWGWSKADHQ